MIVDVILNVNTEVPATFHIEDLIQAINELRIENRFNILSQLLNDSNLDINELKPEHKEIVKKWLQKQIDKF